MEKIGIVAQKLNKTERLLSGLLRINSVLSNPDKYFDKVDAVGGWIKNFRLQNNDKLAFVELSDGSCNKPLQIVIEHTIPNFADFIKENVATCIKVRGTLVKSPAKGQLIEMLVNDPEKHEVVIMGSNLDTKNYPLMGKYPSLELLRNYLHLRPRSNIIGSMSRVRNAIAMATHQFFQEMGFLYVHTPILTVSDCEGAGEMFQVTTNIPKDNDVTKMPVTGVDKKKIDYSKDFFGKPAFMTVSGQLAVENYACALTNVYTFGPTFRAENSNTVRHLAEFWMIEPEICFAGLNELFALVEGYFKFCIDYAIENVADDLDYFNTLFKKNAKDKKLQDFSDLLEYLKGIRNSNFARITYTEAIEYLQKVEANKEHKFEISVFWGMDLNSEHERYICEKLVKGPVFLYNYPKEIKAFYMKLNDDKKTVQNLDLLLPFIGEVVGGSVREERLDVLEERYKECGLNPEDYKFYSDLRRYGTVPHAGFGVGFERLIMLITGIENIREAIPFPRYPGHCEC
jgi:asparaginyl-tRNA synthetase